MAVEGGVPKTRLDLNRIDLMLKELSEGNFVKRPGFTPSADQLNRLSQALGCYDDFIVNISAPDEDDGSNLFFVLMYQNLLLAKRVSELEQ